MENTEKPPVSTVSARVPERRRPGSFVKGVSGNPKGREKGSKNKLTLYREAVLMKQEKKLLQNLPEVLDVVIQKAKEGDMQATKLYLDRVMAAKRLADENAEERGPPQINIVIQGARARATMGKAAREDFASLDVDPDLEEGEILDSEPGVTTGAMLPLESLGDS